jgi:HEAT repeat protein
MGRPWRLRPQQARALERTIAGQEVGGMAWSSRLVALALLSVLSLGTAWGDKLDDEAVADLCQCLQSRQADVQAPAFARLVALGNGGVAALLAVLGSSPRDVEAGAQTGLRLLAHLYNRPDAPRGKRAAFVSRLSKYVLGDAPVAGKAAVIGVLATCGGEDAITPLAASLGDEELAEVAGTTLARMPEATALETLQDALPGLDSKARLSVIRALGDRGDSLVTPLLLTQLEGRDTAARMAAMDALAKTGDPEAVPALAAALGRGSDEEQTAAIKACAYLGAKLLGTDRSPEARTVYLALLEARPGEGLTRQALRALTKRGVAEDVPKLMPLLVDPSPVVREAARDCLVAMSAPETSEALAAAMQDASGDEKLGVLDVLVARGGPTAAAAIAAAVGDPSPEVRLRALKLQGRPAAPEVEATLLEITQTSSGPARGEAADAYLELGNARWQAARDGQLEAFARALELAPSDALRARALTALANLQMVEPPAEAMFHGATDSEWRAALTVYVAAARRAADGGQPERAVGMLRRALELKLPDDSRSKVLAALGEFDAALDSERASGAEGVAGGNDSEVRPPTPEAEAALGAINETSPEATKAEAAEAYLELGDARWQAARDGQSDAFVCALEIAPTDALRDRALRALTHFERARPPTEPDRRRDDRAGLTAYIDFACRTADGAQRERAIEMLRKVLDPSLPRELGAVVVAKLRELGVIVDPARDSGCVTTWWVIGPFPGDDIDKPYPPEDRVDLAETLQCGRRDLTWRVHHTPDTQGVVELNSLVQPDRDMTAYLYAEITVDREQDALLKTGSDDNEKVWLNGGEVYRYPGLRMIAADAASVPVRLSGGRNRILVKVGNSFLGWLVCVRFTDPQGNPLQFTQKES